MPTLTIYTEDLYGRLPRELDTETSYIVKVNRKQYGIIVITDTLRVAPGKTMGPFTDEQLTLQLSKKGIDIKYGDPVKHVDLNAKFLFLVPAKTGDYHPSMNLIVPE